MADEKQPAEGGEIGTATADGGESVLDDAVRKVREQRDEKVPFTIVEEKPLPKSMRQLVVEVPRDEWERRLETLFKELRANASIEGFRKGKVQVKLLQRRFIKEATAELVEKITPSIVRDYEQDKQLTMYGVPSVTEYQTDEGKPVRLTVEIEVKPDIEPKNYSGLEIEVPQTKMTEDMVSRRIEELRQQNATFEEVDRELKETDAAVLDLKGVDAKGHTVEQETNKLYENPHAELPHALAHELFGKKAGDTVETKEGNIRYTATLKAVKELKLPEVDDEYAKDLGYENADAMRKSIEEGIQRYLDSINEDEAFEVLVSKLVESHEFEVPPALKQHVERDMARSDYMYYSRTGMAPPRLRNRKSRTEYQEELDKAAEQRVKGFLLIDAIGRLENVQADDTDINAALEERAKQEGRKPAAIRAALERKREYSQFTEQVRFNKIRTHLLSKTKISYVDPPKEEAAEGEDNAGAEGTEETSNS